MYQKQNCNDGLDTLRLRHILATALESSEIELLGVATSVSYSIHTYVLCVKFCKTAFRYVLTSSKVYSGLCASSAVGVSTTVRKRQFVVIHRHTALRGTEGT